MTKVLILPSNTDLNRGDQALVWESARIVKDVYGDDVEICLVDSGSSSRESFLQCSQTKKLGYKFITPILRHPSRFFLKKTYSRVEYGWLKLFQLGSVAIFDFCRSIALLSRNNYIHRFGLALQSKNTLKAIYTLRDSDAVFVKGGGFLHAYGSITDPYQMYYFVFSILLAQRYDKKVVMLPNSIGPLKGCISKYLVRKALAKCVFVSTREHKSFSFLKQDLHLDNFYYPDLGYFLKSADKQINLKTLTKVDRPFVGITVRPWRFPTASNPILAYESYIDELAKFIVFLSHDGFHVCLFAHTLGPSAHENDALAIEDLVRRLNDSVKYSVVDDKELTCQDVMGLYSQCDYFIGTRFHSVIFSQNEFVPTIAISYGGNKGEGIMDDIGLSKYVIPIENVNSERLESMFKSMKSNKNFILAQLREYRVKIDEERSRMISQLRNILLEN